MKIEVDNNTNDIYLDELKELFNTMTETLHKFRILCAKHPAVITNQKMMINDSFNLDLSWKHIDAK